MCETNIKLSDRIANNVKNLLEYHQHHSYFGRILLTGDDHNAQQICKQMWTNILAIKDWWFAIHDSALQKADTESDKQVIEQIIRETRLYANRRENKFKQEFGVLTDNILANLLPQSFWMFSQYLAKEALFGSLNELIAVSFGIYFIRVENLKLKTHPNFKPNPYYDLWCGEDLSYELRFLLNAHKLLLDSKESVISAEEETHLTELVKKTIAFRHICCIKSQMNSKRLVKTL